MRRVRVAVYVTRDVPSGREVLVFDHRDHPEAGTQIPAGGVRTKESLSDAAVREVHEETGLADLRLQAALGVQDREHLVTGQQRITVFMHALTADERTQWTHTVPAATPGEDSGLVFCCYFVPIADANGLLADNQGEFVTMLDE